ncbi:MAG: Gfo/Idh/MocA family oxidoreductase [Hymenobacteraceae bacterium]|nr:Gfo/Idh/MocA family oxidoreductase [Hymenobacteraceae bacterium]
MVGQSAGPIPADQRPLRLGVIGLNAGNGHPYSFSAIANGFDEVGFAVSAWAGIHAYLRERDPADFGVAGVQVTHCWTQDRVETDALARAARIPHVVDRVEEMIGHIDALLLLRDDVETHRPMAEPFLAAGLPVFIDKPLALDLEDLRYFRPFLESGQLMSTAGVRYSRELDAVAATIRTLGELTLVRGAVVGDWRKYGIHMLDGIFRVIPFAVEEVWSVPGAQHESVVLRQADGQPLVQIDALGATVKTFQFDFFGRLGRLHAEHTDNFSAFRRELTHFVDQVRTGRPSVDPAHTIRLMQTMIAAELSRAEGRPVRLTEIAL